VTGSKLYRLTEKEAAIIRASASSGDPNLFLRYWTGGEYSERLQFDEGFHPDGQWQVKATMASQKNIIILGGVGTGKTLWAAWAPFIFSCWYDDFRYLNLAPKLKQADLARSMIVSYRDSRVGKLIRRVASAPQPMVEVAFEWPNGRVHRSRMTFGSLANGADAYMGFEADWINIDESFQLDSDNFSEIYAHLGTRLRGKTRSRRVRMGRFSQTTNPWANTFGWYLVFLAEHNPKDYLFMRLSTLHNKNISEEQVRSIVEKIPRDQRMQFINGARPVGTGTFFSENDINICSKSALWTLWNESDAMIRTDTIEGLDVTEFMVRPILHDQYITIADFGTGNAPYRNAPVVMTWNISRKPERLDALWWGQGNKSMDPLIEKILEHYRVYAPVYVGVDATGTQGHTAQIMEEIYNIRGYDFRVNPIDTSGQRKAAYLTTLRMLIESHSIEWPKVDGIDAQLLSYKLPDNKIPQDLVMTMMMSAVVINGYRRLGDADMERETMHAFRSASAVPYRPLQHAESSFPYDIAPPRARSGRRKGNTSWRTPR